MDGRPQQRVALERLVELPHLLFDREGETRPLDRDAELILACRGQLAWVGWPLRKDRMLDLGRVDGLSADVDVAGPRLPAPGANGALPDVNEAFQDPAATAKDAIPAPG